MFAPAIRVSVVIMLAAVALLALLALSSAPPTASAGDKDCADFKNQRKAQRFFKKHDPKQDRHRLDADNDGIACESNPCPCKGKSFRITGHAFDGREHRLVTITS